MLTKEAVRLACKAKRAALRADECLSWAQALGQQIVDLPEYESAQSVMLYLAMPKEANVDSVITQALQDGKEVYVPVCIDKTHMIAAQLQSLADVETGVLHIRIPKEPYRTIDPEQLDLVLVPGLAFDRYGGRMGMGNGYYDRFLQKVQSHHFIGVGWQMQVLEDPIPMGEWDMPMTKIVTEQELIVVKKTY